MRYFVLFFLITVLCRTGIAQTPDFNDICKKYNKEENITSIRINRLGCFILSCFVRNNEPENNIVQNFIRQSSAFQLLIAEGEYSQALIKDVNNFIKGNQWDELLNIKDKGKVIKIFALAKTQKEIIRKYLALVQKKQEVADERSNGKVTLFTENDYDILAIGYYRLGDKKKSEEYAKKYEERYKLRVADIKETFKDEKMQAEVDAEYLRRMNEFHAKVGMK